MDFIDLERKVLMGLSYDEAEEILAFLCNLKEPKPDDRPDAVVALQEELDEYCNT